MTKQLNKVVLIAFITGLATFFAGTSIATASTLHVKTTGNDSNDCLSPATACLTIQEAVNKAADGDTINVAAGNYAGSVSIAQRTSLTIAGVTGAAISDPGLAPGSAVVIINLSQKILFRDFTFSGNPAGVEAIRIFDSIGISIQRSTIERANLGFFLNNSGVNISDSTIQDNGIGIRVDGGSFATLSSAPFSPGTSTVQRNNNGVFVRAGYFGMHGATIVQDNNIGINGGGGVIKVCCQDGLRKINNNNVGIQLRGDHLELRGPLEMAGNRSWAIIMFGGFATISDRASIHDNGSTPETGGIAAVGGRLELNGFGPNDVDISNNTGNGVLVIDGGTARVLNTLISNNSVHGLRVEALSVARLFDTAVIKDNGGFDFSCTPNSFGRGGRSGVRRMLCPGFDQSPNPVPGGPNNP